MEPTLAINPVLPPCCCRTCGVVAVPRVERGTGPHIARASCAACGGFLKWLPRALFTRKAAPPMGGVNRVVLLGTIGQYGVEVRYTPSGAPCANFTVAVAEVGQDGKEQTTLIPCECWGKKAEAAGELEAGQLVLFEGKLRTRQKGEQWECSVSGFEVTPITAAVPALTGSYERR